jgi:hypothetical protein
VESTQWKAEKMDVIEGEVDEVRRHDKKGEEEALPLSLLLLYV